MSITLESIRQRIAGNGFFRRVRPVGDGHIGVQTILSYPDGSPIEVYIDNPGLLKARQDFELSDFANSSEWLSDFGMSPASGDLAKLISIVASPWDVRYDRSQLLLDRVTLDTLPEASANLAQACLRVADLSLRSARVPKAEKVNVAPKKKYQTKSALSAYAAELFDHLGLPFKRNKKLEIVPGARPTKVDFYLPSENEGLGDGVALALSATTEGRAEAAFEHVFTVLEGCRSHRKNTRLFAISNESIELFDRASLNRIEGLGASILDIRRERAFKRALAS